MFKNRMNSVSKFQLRYLSYIIMNSEISNILKTSALLTFSGTLMLGGCSQPERVVRKPNFIILMSDNHSPEHLGCYGDKIVKTPIIDKIANEGIRFTNAFCSAPSCSPARASMLTGMEIWRMEEAINLWGIFPVKFEVFPELLEKAGYHVGIEGKGWGPGSEEASGRDRNPGGERYYTFEEFYTERQRGQPFFYWFSSRDPHRPYSRNAGEKAGIDISKIEVPPYLPDTEAVRKDIADYYAEIQSFNNEVSHYINLLNEMGQLENTVIIICGDNGWQVPRGLANLYTMGTKVPLIISLPGRFIGNRVVDDFVKLDNLAPTILELAGIEIPSYMNAKSLVNILESEKSGIINESWDFTVTARERHAFVRKAGAGYGCRALQTKDFIYIRNYDYESWPAGDPPLYGDADPHMMHYPAAPKMEILVNRDDPDVKPLFDLAFGKRPFEELYDLNKDPYQMVNVAGDPEYQEILSAFSDRLTEYLQSTGDPREAGGKMKWIGAEYFATQDFRPRPNHEAIELLGLEEEYSYID